MSQILIRQLPIEVHHALKARAKQEARSAEAVAREILTQALLQPSNLGFGDKINAIWQDADLSDVDFERDKTPYQPLDLS
jgi:plasmid stability protein